MPTQTIPMYRHGRDSHGLHDKFYALSMCGDSLRRWFKIPLDGERIRLHLDTRRPDDDEEYVTLAISSKSESWSPVPVKAVQVNRTRQFISGGISIVDGFLNKHKAKKCYAWFTYLEEDDS